MWKGSIIVNNNVNRSDNILQVEFNYLEVNIINMTVQVQILF